MKASFRGRSRTGSGRITVYLPIDSVLQTNVKMTRPTTSSRWTFSQACSTKQMVRHANKITFFEPTPPVKGTEQASRRRV
jgi:hypothetical protein